MYIFFPPFLYLKLSLIPKLDHLFQERVKTFDLLTQYDPSAFKAASTTTEIRRVKMIRQLHQRSTVTSCTQYWHYSSPV